MPLRRPPIINRDLFIIGSMEKDGLKNSDLRRGGRPSQSEASQIRERILDIATDLFLTQGYGATSIEAIAKQAAMSKRTFYHRFDDKADLFGAVVHRLIGRLRPPQVAPLFEGIALPEILQRLAKIILHAALSPEAIALHRLMISETARFPELAAIMDAEGSRQEAIARIADLLEHHAGREALPLENATFAAQLFLQMIVSEPQRRALGLGTPMTPAELNVWSDNTVNFFLRGCHLSQ